MGAKNIVMVLVAPFIVSGCANLNFMSAKTAKWPWEGENTKLCAGAQCTVEEALNAYVKANKFCRDVQNYYEAGGQRANGTKLAVGVVGTLAGAVIAPVAKGSATTAWSGLSGAANGIQTSFDEAFSSSIAVSRRLAVVTAAAEGDNRYQQKSDPDSKVVAAISMATACAHASAVADNQTLQSLAVPTQAPQLLPQTSSQSVSGSTQPDSGAP